MQLLQDTLFYPLLAAKMCVYECINSYIYVRMYVYLHEIFTYFCEYVYIFNAMQLLHDAIISPLLVAEVCVYACMNSCKYVCM